MQQALSQISIALAPVIAIVCSHIVQRNDRNKTKVTELRLNLLRQYEFQKNHSVDAESLATVEAMYSEYKRLGGNSFISAKVSEMRARFERGE